MVGIVCKCVEMGWNYCLFINDISHNIFPLRLEHDKHVRHFSNNVLRTNLCSYLNAASIIRKFIEVYDFSMCRKWPQYLSNEGGSWNIADDDDGSIEVFFLCFKRFSSFTIIFSWRNYVRSQQRRCLSIYTQFSLMCAW